MEYKTQVFVNHEGDHYRTRLTHSLEVSLIGRTVARALHLNTDLVESLALSHDLGHTPFGHLGEEVLDELMTGHGGFNHNRQSLRIVDVLEDRYPDFPGLNLTWEVREGIAKHSGRIDADRDPEFGEFDPHGGAPLEAQMIDLVDEIAYNHHDIDDGLRAGLFTVRDLADVPLAGPIFDSVDKDYPDLDDSRKIHEAVRRLIGAMVEDVLAESRRRIEDAKVATAEEVRALGRPVVGFSEAMEAQEKAVKKFLFENMYRHQKVNVMTDKARNTVRDLFGFFRKQPESLPSDWRRKLEGAGPEPAAQVVADYIAGMTDRFAIEEHRRHCGGEPSSP